MSELPNLPADDVVAGGKEANRVVKTFGQPPAIEKVRDHVELSRSLGLVDYERGVKLGGSGFWIYTGQGARLEWALINWFIDRHVAAGYEFLLPPHLLLDSVGFAAGQFPKFYDDVYHLDRESAPRGQFLLPTAETALLGTYQDEILDTTKLPLKTFAYTLLPARVGRVALGRAGHRAWPPVQQGGDLPVHPAGAGERGAGGDARPRGEPGGGWACTTSAACCRPATPARG